MVHMQLLYIQPTGVLFSHQGSHNTASVLPHPYGVTKVESPWCLTDQGYQFVTCWLQLIVKSPMKQLVYIGDQQEGHGAAKHS